ncbi:MAG TPA: protoporphyrinogen oxidase [Opitutaceae bacterium]
MKVAVLGGGVTGLTAAWRLSAAGHSVRLLEAAPRLGGSVRTEVSGGWTAEAGPNSFQETPEVAALVADLGLAAERVEASPSAQNRYIVLDGKLAALPAPSSMADFMATRVLSLGAKWKVGREFSRKPAERTADVSVAQFMGEHFGQEVVDRVVQPFVSGIYAGDPDRLSARHAFPKIWEAERTMGSLLSAGAESARKRRAEGLPPAPALISFRAGAQALTDALGSRLPRGSVELSAEVRSIGPGSGARWRVEWSGPDGHGEGQFDWVVSALPAGALASLRIGPKGATPLGGLSAIEHPPVASVFVGYRRDKILHALDGFGVLVPAAEKRSILGVIFSSSLFEGRAPAGHVALTVLVGGALQPEVALLPSPRLENKVLSDLEALLGARGKPAFLRQTLWPRAIPQYNLGYELHLDSMAACEGSNPGFLIGGNARDGISIPDCVRSGVSLAKRVS